MSFADIHSLTPETRAAHEKTNGQFNDFPPLWREITEAEFAQSRHFTFAPVLIEYRQMLTPERDKPCVSARLQWQFDGTGFAVVNDYWAKRIRFYTFGAQPEGYTEHFDSSG